MVYTFKLNYPNGTSEYFNLTFLQFSKELNRLQKFYNNKLTFKILELS